MLTLILGGAASGKSGYAESLVLKTALPRYYIATMQVWDAECAARVEKHRRMRAAKQFETVECPLHLENIRLPARGTALLEDLGNLTANELYDPAGREKMPLRPFWKDWTNWPDNARTSLWSPTRCSAAVPTTQATPGAT